MSNNWRSKIEGLLRDEMRYCFELPVTWNEQEFYDGDRGGMLVHVIELVESMRKEMFMEGYSCGVIDAIADLKVEGVEYSDEINRITAERRFLARDK